MKKLNCILLAMGMALFVEAFCVMAQTPGDPDPTFGTDGKVILQVHNSIPVYPEGMAVQSDGKIVAVVGYDIEQLMRLNSDGSLDSTFGTGGIVRFTWSVGTSYGNVTALALQNVGGQERIVVAGYSPLQVGRNNVAALHVERFMPDGSVDTSFGTNGHTVINTGYADAIAIQPDGKILTVGGDAGKLVRLNANGTLDTAFGSGGVVNSGYGRSLAINAAGGILVGGYVTIGKGNKARQIMTVKRYSSSGVADTGFGSAGIATADFGTTSQLWNLAIDVLGNILAGGSAPGPALARFTPNGLVDTTFGGTGKVVFPGLAGAGRGLVMQNDSKIVVTGQSNNNFGLVRFNYDGSVDTGFGNGGSVVADVYGADFSNVSVLQIDPLCACPKIVMSGGAVPNTTFARFIVQ